jgi:adenylate kinase family enzyme
MMVVQTYREDTAAVLQHFREAALLHEVDAARPIRSVYNDVRGVILSRLQQVPVGK